MDDVKKRSQDRIYAERRVALIAEMGGRCAKCGETNGLHFDHVDPSQKTMEISKTRFTRSTALMDELKKCQLLCTPCHAEKTIYDKGQKPAVGTHGTLSAYRYCKCDECRGAQRDYMRTYMREYRQRVGSSAGRASG